MLVFKLHESVWELSMVRISYKLTKRTTKTEKIGKTLKILKKYNFINFTTAPYKLMRLSSIFRLPNEKKTFKSLNSKKVSEKSVEATEK